MAGSILDISEIKLALKKEELNFKIFKNPELNGVEDSVIFIDECSKVKLRGKIVRTFNEGEVHHWPLLNHENVARLIDILRIRDDIYIYLTIHHEVTLKNIVHDENFVYDSRCFDRKRLYAKGIFAGLSYLHSKSLTLMNICDDNIVISTTEDRPVITNFDHLTIARKAIKSRLNVPEMYMAPETEKGEFDASKAEIWACGILMLDMFFAHMVPWAVVNYKPKKVIQIVDTMSLDLLQAANAGSIVTAVDLAKFKIFLKCFFKSNPQERIPAKYASIASFLQNRDRYKMFTDSNASLSFPEYILSENFSNQTLPEEHVTICLNPTYDPSSYSRSPCVENTKILSTTNDPYISTEKTQQTNRSVHIGENKVEIDETLSGSSRGSIQVEKEEKNSSHKSIVSIADVRDDFQKTSKSWDTVKEEATFGTKSSYNCYQTNSLSFIKPDRRSNNEIEFKLFSMRNCCESNNKPSEKESDERSEFDLNLLFNDNVFEGIENNPNNNADSNSVVEYDGLNTVTDENFSEILKTHPVVEYDGLNTVTDENLLEILKTRHFRTETQVKQRILGDHTSSQTSVKHIVKPPRNSKAPPLFLTAEIKSVASKIIYLRKCFISIQTHRKVNISKEFENKQRKIIKEYQTLLLNEYSGLLEMLRKNYELKIVDIKKLISYVNRGNQFVSLNQNFDENHWNRLLQTCEMKGAIKGDTSSVSSYTEDKLKGTNITSGIIRRKHSYYRAIENANTKAERKWETNDQLENKRAKMKCKKTNFDSNNELKPGYLTTAAKSDQMDIEEYVAERVKLVKQHEERKKNVKTADEINSHSGTRQKQAEYDGSRRVEMTKPHQQGKIVQKERYLNTIEDVNYNRCASSKIAKNKERKNKKKRVEINTNEKSENRKKPEKKEKQKFVKSKKCVEEKSGKKEKKQQDPKKQEEPKRKWFSICPGGRVEEEISDSATFCEACKLNLQIK